MQTVSRIEQLIGEIEMYLDSCKSQAFSNSKRIVVEKDVIDEMLVELRMRTPEEIKKYQKIIANKEAILADAQSRADAMIADANRQTAQLVNEHEITRQAQAQAEQLMSQAEAQAQSIVDKAVMDANSIREGAIQYTDSQLATLQNLISGAMENTQSRYNSFMSQLQSSLEVISTNRSQLNPGRPSAPAASSMAGDDYDIDIALGND